MQCNNQYAIFKCLCSWCFTQAFSNYYIVFTVQKQQANIKEADFIFLSEICNSERIYGLVW